MTKTARSFFLVLVIAMGACAKRVQTFHEGDSMVGFASWYGNEFHGRKTASGERYDMNDLTGAHRTAPFGTQMEVTNLSCGKSIVVRINDRGPFVRGRIIDLSKRAAQAIDLVGAGTAKVRLRVVAEAAAPANEAFYVQVGSFRDRTNAVKLLDGLEAKGNDFPGTVEEVEGLSRVWIGPFASETAAQSAEGRLKGLGFETLLLRR